MSVLRGRGAGQQTALTRFSWLALMVYPFETKSGQGAARPHHVRKKTGTGVSLGDSRRGSSPQSLRTRNAFRVGLISVVTGQVGG